MCRYFLNLRTVALFMGLAFIAVSCTDDDDFPERSAGNNFEYVPPAPINSIVDVAAASGQNGTPAGYDSLAVALQITGQNRSPLGEAGNYTVFAPTNQAFVDYLNSRGFDRISQIPYQELSALMSYHIVEGNVSFTGNEYQFVRSIGQQTFNLRNQPQVEINAVGSDSITVGVNGVLNAQNGRLYPVNKVLVPAFNTGAVPNQTLTQTIVSKNLLLLDSALSHAVVRQTIVQQDTTYFTLKDSLSSRSTGLFTFFAPTDVALRTYLTNSGYASIEDVPQSEILPYLYNHMVMGTVPLGIIFEGQKLDAARGNLIFTTQGADRFVQHESNAPVYAPARIQEGDILTTSGMIHIIESPLDL